MLNPLKGAFTESSSYTPMTVHVLGDFDHESSAGLLKESLESMVCTDLRYL